MLNCATVVYQYQFGKRIWLLIHYDLVKLTLLSFNTTYLINSWRETLKARFQNLVGGECLNGIHTVDFDLRIATGRESEFPPTKRIN